MNHVLAATPSQLEPLPHPRAFWRILASTALVTAIADWLLYGVAPGASAGLFSIFLAAAILANRPGFRADRSMLSMLALLFGAAIQSAIECSFSNFLVLVILLLALTGHTYYEDLKLEWTRWSEAGMAVLKAVGRWLWLIRAVTETGGVMSRLRFALKAVIPTIILTAVFTLLFSFGNVIFGQWATEVWTGFQDILFPPFSRIVFWTCASTLALSVLHPALAPATRRHWNEIPGLPLSAEAMHLRSMQSFIALAAMNLLFLAVNTVDATYLWLHTALPQGVTHSQFVHQGVYNLILCVVISAAVIATIFEQRSEVVERPRLKLLGVLWIAQNLFLLASVGLRLKLYVDEFQLTTQRVYVLIFLALVAAGFLLLGWKILRARSFRWLILSNVAATFLLFYTVQFLNVAGFVAHYNVDRWLAQPDKPFDVEYLETLGPPAWPALLRAGQDPRDRPESRRARELLLASLKAQRIVEQAQTWKSWQARTWTNQRRVERDLSLPEGSK